MQQRRDDLDNIISQLTAKISVSDDYNDKLMLKLNNQNESKDKDNYFYKGRAAALSLIISGFLFIFMNTASFSGILFNIDGRVRSHILTAQYEYNYKIEAIKNSLGGNINGEEK